MELHLLVLAAAAAVVAVEVATLFILSLSS